MSVSCWSFVDSCLIGNHTTSSFLYIVRYLFSENEIYTNLFPGTGVYTYKIKDLSFKSHRKSADFHSYYAILLTIH